MPLPVEQAFSFNELLLMLFCTLENMPIAMSMAVSLLAVIERSTKHRGTFFNLQSLCEWLWFGI